MDSLLIGVAQKKITPKLGCELAGFDARKGVATNIHDDLFARALVVSDGKSILALASLDLIGISQEFTDGVRKAVHASRGIAESDILLCATHTHCGPVTINHFFNAGQRLDREYLSMLHQQVVGVIEEAYDQRAAGVIRSGLVQVQGVAVNRRTEDGKPIDDYAGVLLIEDLHGESKSIIVSYACHPTVLGPDTLDVTRDFPHYLLTALNSHLGDDVLPIYFNGTEGDLSVGHKSFLSAVGVIAPNRTYEKAQELGERLAQAVIAGLDTLVVEKPKLTIQHAIVPLPLKSYAPLSMMKQITLNAKDALRQSEETTGQNKASNEAIQKRQDYLFARIEEYYAGLREQDPSPNLSARISVVSIGETSLLVLPGEVFVEIGLSIRDASPSPRTMLFGLANDYIGYIPTIAQAKESGYEVVASRVTPEASLVLIESATTLLKNSAAKALTSIFFGEKL
jgi:neutral ceramidase